MNRTTVITVTGVFLVLLAVVDTASAWNADGHEMASRLAVAALPDEAPSFFRSGADAIAAESLDPDRFRNRSTMELTNGEAPEHFFDSEMLKGRPVPSNRYAFIALCAEMHIDPKFVGTLPYSVTEWAEKLTVAFAEYRRTPGDRNVQAKCLVYAGIMSHYAADLCQPLHTTIDYDGRAIGTRSPHSGIHMKVDALPDRLALGDVQVPRASVHAFEKIFPAVVEQIVQSHSLVNRVYELERRLPPADGEWKSDPAVMDFVRERMRTSGTFVASLFLTAWRQSANIEIPSWSDPRKPR